MKVQKKSNIQGSWAKAKVDIDTGDKIEILSAGEIVPGDYGDRHVFSVKTKNGEKNLTFNQTTMNYLIDAFGEETSDWIGEEVKVWIIKSNIAGKMRNVVYLTETDWIETDDGFYPPTKESKEVKEEDIPVIEP